MCRSFRRRRVTRPSLTGTNNFSGCSTHPTQLPSIEQSPNFFATLAPFPSPLARLSCPSWPSRLATRPFARPPWEAPPAASSTRTTACSSSLLLTRTASTVTRNRLQRPAWPSYVAARACPTCCGRRTFAFRCLPCLTTVGTAWCASRCCPSLGQPSCTGRQTVAAR